MFSGLPKMLATMQSTMPHFQELINEATEHFVRIAAHGLHWSSFEFLLLTGSKTKEYRKIQGYSVVVSFEVTSWGKWILIQFASQQELASAFSNSQTKLCDIMRSTLDAGHPAEHNAAFRGFEQWGNRTFC